MVPAGIRLVTPALESASHFCFNCIKMNTSKKVHMMTIVNTTQSGKKHLLGLENAMMVPPMLSASIAIDQMHRNWTG